MGRYDRSVSASVEPQSGIDGRRIRHDVLGHVAQGRGIDSYDGNPAIQAAGLNPWCINEGLATGEENISTWWIEEAMKNSKEAI